MEENEVRTDAGEAREKELDRRELRLLARETLAEKGLDSRLLSLVSLDSRESCMSSITTLENTLNAAVRSRLSERGAALPGAAQTVDDDAMTDAEYYACKRAARNV